MTTDAISQTWKKVLVTGATGGIGWAICCMFADLGYRVALADKDEGHAEAFAAKLGPAHIGLGADLTDPAVAAALPLRAAKAMGGLDVLINNAGITDTSGRTLVELPQEAFDRVVALNLTAVERLCASARDILPAGSSIVNLASGASYKALILRGPYSASKAGIAALTEALAAEYADDGISVSAVAPGYTRTPLVESLRAEGRVDLDAVARSIPLGRVAEPEDIAAAVTFCAGPGRQAMAGSVLGVDGGSSAGLASPDTAPKPGAGTGGARVVLGGSVLEGFETRIAAPSELSKQKSVAAVVDFRTAFEHSSAKVLSTARETAKACVAHTGRTADFLLLFVVPRGKSAWERAASAALAMFARTLALEVASAGLRINCIIDEGQGTASDLAALCEFLSGPDACQITGQTIRAGAVKVANRPTNNNCIAL